MPAARPDGKKRAAQAGACRITILFVRSCDHRAVSPVPRVLKESRAVAPPAEPDHVMESKTDEHRREKVAACQRFEAVPPIIDRLSPPQRKGGLYTGMIGAILLGGERSGEHDAAHRAAGDAGNREQPAPDVIRIEPVFRRTLQEIADHAGAEEAGPARAPGRGDDHRARTVRCGIGTSVFLHP